MLFRLALSGIKGRKKESFLLGFVVILSLIFVVTSILLHASNQAVKRKERIATFGPWENAYFQVSKESAQAIKNQKNFIDYGESKLIGDSEDFGLLGTYNKNYERLSDIKMIKGRMPTKKFEIAIENNQLAQYPYDLKIGDQIDIPIVIKLHSVSDHDILITQLKRILAEYKQSKDAFIEAAKNYESLAFLGYPNLEEFLKNMDETSRDQAIGTIETYIESLENKDNDLQAFLNYTNTAKFLFIERNQRYSLDTEILDDFTVNLKTYYNYDYSSLISKAEKLKAEKDGLSTSLPEDYDPIISKGSISSVELIFTYTFTVTGFYDNHSNYWDIGDYSVPSVYATDSLYDDINNYIQDNAFVDVEDYEPLLYSKFNQSNILVTSNLNPWTYLKENTSKYPSLKTNSYSYPRNDLNTDTIITYSLLALIFVGTITTIFQINLSQLKRRSKRFTLLKAIGMVKGQMVRLIIWEMLIIITVSFPLGIILGFGLTYGLIHLLNSLYNLNLLISINTLLLFYGVLSCFISIILGMTYPVMKALKSPLMGAMNSLPLRKKSKSKKEKNRFLNFFYISFSHLIYDKKNTLVTISLYTISISVLIVSLFLAFLSFNRYKDEVIATDKPDYVINTIRGISNDEIESLNVTLNNMNAIKNHQIIKYNMGTFVHHDSFYNHQLFNHHYENRDFVNLNVHDEKTADFKNTSIIANIYGIESNSYVFNALTAHMNDFDVEKFNSGQGVILLLPQYNKKTLERSLDYRNRHITESNYPIEPGDVLTFGKNSEPFLGDRLSRNDQFGNYSLVELIYSKKEILATGHKTDRIGVWPFSNSLENPVIITSIKGLNQLYPSSKSKIRMSFEELKNSIETSYPTYYGKTKIFIYTQGKKTDPDFQLALKKISVDLHGNLEPLYLEKDQVFNQSFKLATIIMTLGLSISLLLLMVLYNTSESKIESERRRIGILQALGVTKKQFKLLYFFTGLAYGLIGLTIANIIFGLIVISFAIGFGGPLIPAIENVLWLYPFKVHYLLSLLFLTLATLSYYYPVRKTLKLQAIYNINSNQR